MKLSRRRNRATTNNNMSHFFAIAIVAILVLLNNIPFIHANWIDPETPIGAYTTKPRYMPPPTPAKVTTTDDTKTDTKKSRYHPATYEPTSAPTTHPTPFPTLNPTKQEDTNDERQYHLIMSDEFNIDGRSFADGHDPKWTALDKNDYTNGALHYYSPDNVKTVDGDLLIKTEAKHTDFVGFDNEEFKNKVSTKNFKSGMLQTWNKFCFTGGIIEAEIQIPGKAEIGGLWPAFWLLGNMARHTYVGSTNHIWPWSSNVCTPLSKDAQRINGCMKAQHYGLHKGVGRGAPEIDIFEVQSGKTKANTDIFLESSVGQPFLSASYQVAPGRPNNRPGGGWWPGPGQWYNGLTGGANTSLNIFFYGDYNHFRGDPDIKDYWSDAVSFNHQLQDTHFERKHKYRLEWELPEEDGHDGYIRWFIDDHFVLQINGTGIVEAGTGSTISTEPMYIIMNTAISTEWGFPRQCPTNCPCKKYDCLSSKFPDICGFTPGFCDMIKNTTALPTYKTNYVRVYQNKNDPRQKIGCSTPERPTSKYIEAHEDRYMKTGDTSPLKPIQRGAGKCVPDIGGVSAESCGGPNRGLCSTSLTCECLSGWTGPHCLSPDGFDPIVYEKKEVFADLEFTGPRVNFSSGLYVGLAVMALLALFAPIFRRRLDNLKPLSW